MLPLIEFVVVLLLPSIQLFVIRDLNDRMVDIMQLKTNGKHLFNLEYIPQ